MDQIIINNNGIERDMYELGTIEDIIYDRVHLNSLFEPVKEFAEKVKTTKITNVWTESERRQKNKRTKSY